MQGRDLMRGVGGCCDGGSELSTGAVRLVTGGGGRQRPLPLSSEAEQGETSVVRSVAVTTREGREREGAQGEGEKVTSGRRRGGGSVRGSSGWTQGNETQTGEPRAASRPVPLCSAHAISPPPRCVPPLIERSGWIGDQGSSPSVFSPVLLLSTPGVLHAPPTAACRLFSEAEAEMHGENEGSHAWASIVGHTVRLTALLCYFHHWAVPSPLAHTLAPLHASSE